MPQIIPIRDLKNTSAVSELCHRSAEPIFVTKNGYGDMVLMSMEIFEKNMFMQDIYRKLDTAEVSIANGNTTEGHESIANIREKYGL
jgi:PHD/YefM family antitoxin component YafN of YafNO toxin-antitoxin module